MLLRKIGLFLLDIIQTITLSLALFVISYLFFFQPEKVFGTSMLPTLHNSDFMIAEKVSYRFGEPKRGDIIVIKAPSSETCFEDGCDYVKRLIGLPNENIEISDGHVYINKKLLEENYLPIGLITQGGTFLKEDEVLHLNENEYLVLGDNRPYSRDGRFFGPIPRSSIVGRIVR